MKRILLGTILGLSTLAPLASVQAQGNINLYNYASGGTPANAIVYGIAAGGPLGQGVTTGGFTVGMYIGAGDQTAAVNGAFNGTSYELIPILALATGVGATTPLGDFEPGEYSAGFEYNTGIIGGTVTVVVVAYNGANYDTSSIRGHSQAFIMTTTSATENAPWTGTFMNGFAVSPPIPEPSTFALIGLGLASLMSLRRRN